jgi:hypothetical protein
MPSGFVDRYKGKGYQPSGWLQQVGSGGAVSPGGGQINSTGAASTSGGIAGSTAANTASTFSLNYVIPPKTLDRFGRNILINAWGTFSTANAGLKSASIVFGTVTGFTVFNSTTITTLQGWNASVSVTCNSTDGLAAKQTIFGTGVASTHSGCTVSTGAENMLLASTIKVTGLSSAGSAGGDVILLGLQVEGLN